MSLDKDKPEVLIPTIRKLMPNIIAQDIVGVQPMTSNSGAIFNIKPKLLPKFTTIDVDGIPAGHCGIKVNFEVQLWIEKQPIHMWKYLDGPDDMSRIGRQQFLVSEQLYTLMALKWSE